MKVIFQVNQMGQLFWFFPTCHRYYGRKIFYMLMAHQDFDRMLSKYVPANSLRNVQDIVDNLRQKVMIMCHF